MTEPASSPAAEAHDDAAHFKAYLMIFGLLCIFTAVSFVSNELDRHGVISKYVSLAIIMAVAVAKATCVGYIFMHLKADWSKVYFIIIPVTIMSIMMIIVLLPDIVLTWHYVPAAPFDEQP
jgi:cytochrome c oxidase subunit 4